jgi:hypothetical protein
LALASPEDLCEFLEAETSKAAEGPKTDVLCVEPGPEGWQYAPPPVAVSVEALAEAAAICNDGCSVWRHFSCDDLIEDTGYGPIPSCSVAVNCKVRWVQPAVCRYEVLDE